MICRGRNNVKQVAFDKIHSGLGTGYVRQLLGFIHGMDMPGDEKDFDTNMSFVHEVTIPPGVVIGPHRHLENEEIYLIIKGEGEMNVDGEKKKVGPGDAILTKANSYHGFKNTGQEDVVFYAIECVMSPEIKRKQAFEDIVEK